MRPMSWYCGSHATSRVVGCPPMEEQIMPRLCDSVPCFSTTPFGADVDPDVYCRNAT